MKHAAVHAPVRRHVLAAAAHGVVGFIGGHNGDAETVLARAGVDRRQLDQPCLSLDLAAYCRMMELAADETRNPNFGLWFGQQFQPESLGLVGELALASPTVGSALDNFARLFPYHQHVTATRFFRQHDGLWRLEYRILDGSIVERRQDAELTMGMFANLLRRCLGEGWHPEEVHFEHPPPTGWTEHLRAFGARPRFARSTNALLFRLPAPEQPMPTADLRRMAMLAEQLRRTGGDTGQLPLLDRVRGEIRHRLLLGDARIDAVAASLQVPRWTLQRRLAQDGVRFSELVDAVRGQLARQYLRIPGMPIVEVARLLGYSETSAFSRACVRWFGAPPSRLQPHG